ncbi:MAG: hypothetical protein ACKOY8_04040 [Verrucomicrobiota bacterium]
MKGFGFTYWFTWALLLVAAALTGVASVKDAFFGGLIAAVPAAALRPVYVRIGARFAPVFGAAVGSVWASLMFLKVRWFGTPDDLAAASWMLGTDIAVHAAAFAGAALFTALLSRGAGLAVGAGLTLSAAMSAIPYGIIAAIDHQVAGPVEVLLLASAEVPAVDAPAPLPGARPALLSDGEVSALKERYLVTEGPSGPVVQDDLGRRYWPLWRKLLVYPGNPGGPVRRLIVLLPEGPGGVRAWKAPSSASPDGLLILQLGPDGLVRAHPLESFPHSVRLELTEGPKGLDVDVVRISPVGDLYMTVHGGPFPATFPVRAAVPEPEARPRPKFDAGR